MSQITCSFVGLGLIGGSIAKSLKKNVTNVVIKAYDINRTSLELAKEEQIVDMICDKIDDQLCDCDFLFLCAPVQKNDENLLNIDFLLKPACILTDVGSVKTDIHLRIRELGLEHQFIGGHPMAGSERVGYVNSNARLLENAYYILTPTNGVPPEKLDAYRDLVIAMGAIPLVLSFEQHDYVTAAISHLPHVIASSLVNLVHDIDSEEGIMKMVAAGGFKDITRIASSSAAMWQQICLTNTDNILKLLDDYIASLRQIRQQLSTRQEAALFDLFEDARVYRDSFISTSSGPIKISYTMNIDIADEPGALAAIATILALHQISIKNIGIVHNRESQDGVLQIEFHEEESLLKAEQILTSKSYHIYNKL